MAPIICTLLITIVLYFTSSSGLVVAIGSAIVTYIAALLLTRTIPFGTK